jgi:anti-sigma regulatory factor (Ser/Thr protein kinase)
VPLAEFRHEAAFYAGEPEFLDTIAPFIADGLEADEPVLVVVGSEKISALRDTLGRDGARVEFADMAAVGSNPARIIPEWRSFVDAHRDDGPRLRGVGEPIWAARTANEVLECHQHEALLNVAFTDRDRLWLRCPYDTVALAPSIIDEARRTHAVMTTGGVSPQPAPSPAGARWDALAGPPLPEPAGRVDSLHFDRASIATVRRVVFVHATRAGLDDERADALALAVHEAASNSVRHGGGRGTARIWHDKGDLVCEIRDSGSIAEPLVGRVRPDFGQEGGRGLWIVHQLCDLSQVRSSPSGTTVRMRMRLQAAVSTA